MTTEADALKFTAEQAVTANGKRIIETKNRQFLINGNGDIRKFRPNDGANEALQVHTLTAVVDYIGKVSERSASPLIVQVVDENSVFVLGELDDFGNREVLIKAKAMHPCYPYGQWLDSESFIIALQAQFMTTEDGKVLLKFVGNLKDESAQTMVDDGVSQVATARSGVASVGKVVSRIQSHYGHIVHFWKLSNRKVILSFGCMKVQNWRSLVLTVMRGGTQQLILLPNTLVRSL